MRPAPHPLPTDRELVLTDYRCNLQRLTLLADVRPVQVRWLWPSHIPLVGDPGLGKI